MHRHRCSCRCGCGVLDHVNNIGRWFGVRWRRHSSPHIVAVVRHGRRCHIMHLRLSIHPWWWGGVHLRRWCRIVSRCDGRGCSGYGGTCIGVPSALRIYPSHASSPGWRTIHIHWWLCFLNSWCIRSHGGGSREKSDAPRESAKCVCVLGAWRWLIEKQSLKIRIIFLHTQSILGIGALFESRANANQQTNSKCVKIRLRPPSKDKN